MKEPCRHNKDNQMRWLVEASPKPNLNRGQANLGILYDLPYVDDSHDYMRFDGDPDVILSKDGGRLHADIAKMVAVLNPNQERELESHLLALMTESIFLLKIRRGCRSCIRCHWLSIERP